MTMTLEHPANDPATGPADPAQPDASTSNTATSSTAASNTADGVGRAAASAWFGALQRWCIVASTVGLGLAAGFFFTYQISVTRGLAIVDDGVYVESFQAINETIRNTWFGLVFFGSIPLLCATLAVNWRVGNARRGLVAAALGFYVATFAITAAGSVPLNDELGAVTERTPAALAAARSAYESDWNTLNLVRTLTCLGALVAISIAGRLRSSED